jgi:hypothetical protein
MDGYGITITKCIQEAVLIDSDCAIPSLPGSQNASAGTEAALNYLVFDRLPIASNAGNNFGVLLGGRYAAKENRRDQYKKKY